MILTAQFICVLFLRLQFLSADYISTMINGSLAGNYTIKFSLFAEDLKGVIFYGFISFNNSIKLSLIDENATTKRIQINDHYTGTYLRDICGCYPCNYQELNMTIIVNQLKIMVSCNSRKQQNLFTGTRNKINKFGYPMMLVNTTDQTYIMVGNSGPFLDHRGRKTVADKIQLIACVFYFKINETNLHFNGSNESQVGDKVQHRCIKQCVTKDICNKGQCLETYTHLVCLCNNTALNGPRCNNSLKTYGKHVNTYYTLKKIDRLVSLKLTWRPSKGYSKEHCLLEFVNNGKYQLIFVDKNISYSFANVTTNFVNVNITKDSIDYKIMDNNKSVKFLMSENSRINVGFSERSGVCETFNGEYDFIYDKLLIRPCEYPTSTYIDIITNLPDSNINKTHKRNEFRCFPYTTEAPKRTFIPILIVSLVISMTIVCVVITAACIIVRRSSRFKDGVAPASELIEMDEDDYSDTNDSCHKDDNIINDNDAYSLEQYSVYIHSAPEAINDIGPQLPPRDDGTHTSITDGEYALVD